MAKQKMSCVLSVLVSYDPEITDPESLASACDSLLETALSTPGILSEYGDPSFDNFQSLLSHQPNPPDGLYQVNHPSGDYMLIDPLSLVINTFDECGNDKSSYSPGDACYRALLSQFKTADWPRLKPVTSPDGTVLIEDDVLLIWHRDSQGRHLEVFAPGGTDYDNNRRMMLGHQ